MMTSTAKMMPSVLALRECVESVAVVASETRRREGAGLVSSPSDRAELQASAEPSGDVRRAFVGGDLGALGQIFDHYSRSVWSVAMGVLRDRQLADEATQETFMRAWRAADRYDPARPLAPWLLTIARRTALDVIRRESRPTRGGHAPEQDMALNLPGIERAWERWEIKSALVRLPAEEREVVWFAHFHGMSHPQIADQLGVPIGTVKSRSFRAHKRLASMLSHIISEGGTS